MSSSSDAGAATARRRAARIGEALETGRSASEAVIEGGAEFRRRQVSFAAVIEAIFGRFGECEPGLWDRRSYLMLVGVVFDRLAMDENEIPTDEIAALARSLAQNRRVEERCGNAAEPAESSGGEGGDSSAALPEHFAASVRRLYGLELD